MNLREFFNYQTKCPLCNSDLNVNFHSSKKQSMMEEDNRLIIKFTMNTSTFTPHKDCTWAGYSIDFNNNSFQFEFYNHKERYEQLSLDLLKRFRSFDSSHKSYRFYRECPQNHYKYHSNEFNIDFAKSTIGDLRIISEYFRIVIPFRTVGKKYYYLTNYYDDTGYNKNNVSVLEYGQTDNPNVKTVNLDTIEFPLIKFSSTEKIIERMNKFILFS